MQRETELVPASRKWMPLGEGNQRSLQFPPGARCEFELSHAGKAEWVRVKTVLETELTPCQWIVRRPRVLTDELEFRRSVAEVVLHMEPEEPVFGQDRQRPGPSPEPAISPTKKSPTGSPAKTSAPQGISGMTEPDGGGSPDGAELPPPQAAKKHTGTRNKTRIRHPLRWRSKHNGRRV